MNDMIINCSNGYTVKAGDYVQLANRMRQIYLLSSEELVQMGIESRKIFDKRFHPKIISQQLTEIFDLVVKSNEIK
jgi:glycosyltransferase involved in cell wall biosynthesis